MPRRLFTLGSAVSLLLCVAVRIIKVRPHALPHLPNS